MEPISYKVINSGLRVPYALAVHGKEEEESVMTLLKNHKTQGGEKTNQFEIAIAALFRKKHGIVLNSGFSINLIAIELINLGRRFAVITPTLTFSTTLSHLIQKGLKPIFIDVSDKETSNSYSNADIIITNAFLMSCHHGLQ